MTIISIVYFYLFIYLFIFFLYYFLGGYIIHAAAIIQQFFVINLFFHYFVCVYYYSYDPSFAPEGSEERRWVDALVRDVMTPVEKDPLFPSFRNYDWFVGI
jgi:endoglucanase Acf2